MTAGSSQPSNNIAKLDYPQPHEQTSLLHSQYGNDDDESQPPSPAVSATNGPFFEAVANGIRDRDRQQFKREVIRYISFAWAVICTLSCGSITAFSLYAPLFQTRLHYTQAQINTVSIVAELALYLPVPLFGLLVDRRGPPPLAFISAFLFGTGYYLAAFSYRSGPATEDGGQGWPLSIMVIAFVGVGMGTSCMYLASVTTCAKNFGRGKHKGAALAVPIACFGLSGMWQSQVGARLLYEPGPEGKKGDVDVFRYFLFLGSLLLVVGLLGTFLLRIVDEEGMIDAAVENLEASGLLDDSRLYQARETYGTMESNDRRPSTAERAARAARKARRAEEKRKKTWLLNEETRRFLMDPTMWLLTAGFFLVSGTGETFINNLGTIIGTLYPSPKQHGPGLHSPKAFEPTSPATHVSIVAIASTVARILSGTLSDLLGPKPNPRRRRPVLHRRSTSMTSSISSLDPMAHSSHTDVPVNSANDIITVSRITFLVASTLLLSIGQTLLASGTVQEHAHARFWLVSATVGTGYGAAFSLVPIVISCVWGVENFGTNWGIVATAPAGGAAVFGAVYAGVYEWAAGRDGVVASGDEGGKCYGRACYSATFWGMAAASWIACALWLLAWRGPGGWLRRGVAV